MKKAVLSNKFDGLSVSQPDTNSFLDFFTTPDLPDIETDYEDLTNTNDSDSDIVAQLDTKSPKPVNLELFCNSDFYDVEPDPDYEDTQERGETSRFADGDIGSSSQPSGINSIFTSVYDSHTTTKVKQRSELTLTGHAISEVHLAEWKASGVRDDIIKLNVVSLHNAEDIVEYLNIPSERTNDYQSVYSGGWACTGYVGQQFKADAPRLDKRNNKIIKYEIPRGATERYTLLNISDELFIEICNRWGVDPTTKPKAEPHWSFIQRTPAIPIKVAEGVKKAGCWMSQMLIPVIALHGHTMLNIWQQKLSAVSAFYHPSRDMYLGLDNDFAYTTRKSVDLTITRFKNNLQESNTCVEVKAKTELELAVKVAEIAREHGLDSGLLTVAKKKQRKALYIVTLPPPVKAHVIALPEGFKGCDDLWATDGKEGLEVALNKAKPISRFLENHRKCLGYKPDLEFSSTKWEYPVPDDERFVILIGAKGSGKTYAQRQVMTKSKTANEPIIYLSPRRSLNRQTAESMGFVFVEAQEVIDSNQIALCPQSLHKVPVNKFKDCTLVWDETTQCLHEILLGNHSNKNRESLLTNLVLLLTNAKQVVTADADFKYNDINLLKGLIGTSPYIIRNKLAANKYTAYITRGVEINDGVSVAADLIKITGKYLEDKRKIAIYTGSQGEEYKFSSTTLGQDYTNQGYKAAVIDSETLRDPANQSFQCMTTMRDFYSLVRNNDLMIYTQTLGTGFSIEDPNTFDAVFGIFSGVGTPDAARQGIMRYRPLVPRYIQIAERGKTDAGFGHLGIYPEQVKKSLNRNLQYVRRILQKTDLELFKENEHLQINETLDNYICETIANNNYDNANYYEAAIQGLEADGAEIIDITGQTEVEGIYGRLKAIADANKETKQDEICEAEVLQDDDFENLTRSNVIRHHERRSLDKTKLVKRYGIEEITPEIIEQDDKGWYKQLKAHYSATAGYTITNARVQVNHLRNATYKFGDLYSHARKQNHLAIAELLRETKLFDELSANPTQKVEALSDEDIQETPVSHEIFISRKSEFGQHIYNVLVANIQVLNDSFGMKINAKTFKPDVWNFKLIAYVCEYLGLKHSKFGANNNRQYWVAIPDDGRQNIFKYWLEREQVYLDQKNTWQKEREVQKLFKQLKPTITVSDFNESQKSEYFDAAWELVPVYERTLILNRVDGFKVPEVQLAFLNPEDSKFEQYLADIKTWAELSLDLESYGLDAKNNDGLHYRRGVIRFIQISNGVRTYIADLGHRGMVNQATDWRTKTPALTPFFNVLNDKLVDSTVKIIGQNIHFDLRFLRFNGFDSATNVQDTLKGIKIFLGDSGKTGVLKGGYSLGNLVLKLLGLNINKEEQKSDWGRADVTESQIIYAATDPHLTFYVYQVLKKWYANPTKYGFKKLAQDGLQDSWQLENDVIPAAVEMELTGMPIDRSAAQKLLVEYKEIQSSLLTDWAALVPNITYTQPKKLKQYLIDKYNRQIAKLSKETLAELADLAEVNILQKLRAVKIPIQQLEVFLRSSEATGRIQTVFNTLTGTGRFSSGESKKFNDLPNLQSVSAKSAPSLKEYKKEGVRTVVRQTDTQKGFAVIDLAGAHGRIAADVANDKNAIAGNNDGNIDNHSKVAVYVASSLGFELDWQTIQSAVKNKNHTLHTECKIFRDTAKNTFYGWLNGAGAKRIQEQIKANSGQIVALEACQAAIKGCETLYPQVVEFRKELMKYMTSEDALITIDGDTYTINKIQMVNNRILHKTTIVDEQIQLPYTKILAAIWSRTEATALKRAFVKIQEVIRQNPKWGLKIINYVHDEQDFEFNTDFAEIAVTTVRDIIGDEFQKCLQYVKDGREPDWVKLIVNSWADK